MIEELLAFSPAVVQRLHLTSSPRRVAANGLYQRLFFVRYETNCYQMSF